VKLIMNYSSLETEEKDHYKSKTKYNTITQHD